MEDEDQERNVSIDGSSSWETDKNWFQRRIKELESEIKEMKWKRLEDLKANERVLAIFASKKEAWRCEKIQLVNQLEFQRFDNNNESVVEPSRKVIKYVADLKRQKDKAEGMLRNSLAEIEQLKLKTQLEKKQLDAALRSVTDEMMRLQKEMEEKDAFILSQMSKKDTAGFRDSVQAEVRAKEMELSNANNRLRHYTDGEGSREREAEKWKRLYLGLKLEIDNLQIYSAKAVREEDHSGGEICRSSTGSRSRRLESNLDRKPQEEMGRFKVERKSKNEKKMRGLEKQEEKKTSKSEKEIKCRRSPIMC